MLIWFEIIDRFIDGEITDVQCQHCLSATNLGKQYVFIGIKNVCLPGGVISNVKGKRRVQYSLTLIDYRKNQRNVYQRREGLRVRIVGDRLPEGCLPVRDSIDLEDVYMYYINSL